MTVFLELQACFASPDKAALDVVEAHRKPKLLVIDEFQERGETEWENRQLNHIIDLRYGLNAFPPAAAPAHAMIGQQAPVVVAVSRNCCSATRGGVGH